MKRFESWWMAIGLIVSGAGCVGGEEVSSQRALLLLDQEARAAGYVVLGTEVEDRALPIAVSPDEPVSLAGPNGTRQLEVAPGEILLVQGRDGETTRRLLGEEIDPDRLVLDAPADIVAEVADGLGAEVIERGDGRIEIAAPGLLSASADSPAFIEIVEAAVVDAQPRETRGTSRVVARPVTRRATAPVAPVAGGAIAGATPAAALDVRPALMTVNPEYADLPAPVSCDDPVAGTWIARRHFANANDWYFFTMHVQRKVGSTTALTGEILAHSWTGGPDLRNSAQACGLGGEEWVVRMPATGSIRDGRITLNGTDWSVAENSCGWAPGEGQYNIDNFSGAVTGTGEATWSNDDGGRMRGEPFEFRRISCEQ